MAWANLVAFRLIHQCNPDSRSHQQGHLTVHMVPATKMHLIRYDDLFLSLAAGWGLGSDEHPIRQGGCERTYKHFSFRLVGRDGKAGTLVSQQQGEALPT